jgi:long-chain fatty acid transport protein
MPRLLFVMAVIAALTATASPAGNIDYISSRSPDFIRLMSRNASTDGADVVSYNPAGLTALPEGWFLSVGNQMLMKDYTVEATPPGASDPVTYEATTPTMLLPDLYAVYRTGDFAAFAAFTIPAGGGKLDFTEGLTILPLFETGLQQAIYGSPYIFASMSEGRVEAVSNYLGFTLGGAWQLSDGISVALGTRYTSSNKSYDAYGDFVIIDGAAGTPVDTTHHELSAEKSAAGLAGMVGLDFVLSPSINAALRFETATRLEFETETERNDWSAIPALASFNDGYKQRRDLPAIVAAGLEFRISPSVTTSASMNYYLLESADQGEDDGLDDNYENGWDAGLGIEYRLNPETALSAGYLFSSLGGSDTTYNDLEYSLDAHFVGAGAKFTLSPVTDVTLSAARLACVEGEGAGTYEGSIYNKGIWYIGTGISLRL